MMDVLSQIQILIERNKYSEALSRAQQALADHPESGVLYQFIATIHFYEDRHKEAMAAIEQSIGLNAEDDFSFFRKAQIHHALHEKRAAMTAIDQAIMLDPNVADYYGLKALFLNQNEKRDEALQVVREGLAIDGDSTLCNNVKSMIHQSKGDKEASMGHLEAMLEKDPEDALTHTNMGYQHLRNSDIAQAKKHFATALEKDPSFEFARQGMLQAIRATNWPYRLLLRFSFWMEKLGSINRWVLIIGLLIAIRIIPFLVPFYLLIVLWSWFTPPLTEILMVFDRYGKYLMTGPQRTRAMVIAVMCGISVTSLLLWLALDMPLAALATGAFFSIVPLNRYDEDSPTLAKIVQGAFIAGFIGIGTVGYLANFPQSELIVATTFLGMAYTWVGSVGNA